MRTAFINNRIIQTHNYRFESKHYLNEYSFLSLQLEENIDRCMTLGDIAHAFNPPVFKRQFCKKTPRSVQYFQSSDVQNANEFSNTYVFRGQAESLNLLVNKGDVLVTGFGTIGNIRLVSKFQDLVCYANNVCRIRANEDIPQGYLYAVLSSKYGYAQLNKNASGSVVRYIEAPGIKKTLIPNFPESFQVEVDNFIQESAKLREEASYELSNAIEEITQYIAISKLGDIKNTFSSKSVNISKIYNSLNTRLDPTVYNNNAIDQLNNSKIPCKKLSECDVKIWYPGIFKRAYVKTGIPYIKGSSLFNVNPFRSCDYLSRTRTPMLEQLWLKEGQILMTCAGLCGQVKLITKEYEEKEAIGSPDIIRIQSNDSLFTSQYLFAYLQLPFVVDFMQSLKYGSVIERFDAEHAGTIPIVEPTRELSSKITSIISNYMDYTYRAFKAEEEAISMVETEIEKWNKH